jgi:uncharacterized SAM-binding protein YcdF (DUF218 family)
VRLTPTVLDALQGRFPKELPELEGAPAAILVPGGGVNDYVVATASKHAPTGPGKRVVAAVELAARFPSTKILLSGSGEADPVPSLVRDGVGADRIIVEKQSRDTSENASFAARLLHPASSQRYVLITSALHMPRAVGAYRAAGFDVVAYPVEHRRAEEKLLFPLVWKEVFGLIGYFLTWRSSSIFPGP